MPNAPDYSDLELLKAEVVRLQHEVAALRAKQFVMSGGPAADDSPGFHALQARRLGRLVMLEHENSTLRHRLRVEEAKARTLMVDGARRIGDEVFKAVAQSTEMQCANGTMQINIADLMLLICAVPPAPESTEGGQNGAAALDEPVGRGSRG